MMKLKYYTPLSEEVKMALEGILAQSPDGLLEDMPGDLIFEN